MLLKWQTAKALLALGLEYPVTCSASFLVYQESKMMISPSKTTSLPSFLSFYPTPETQVSNLDPFLEFMFLYLPYHQAWYILLPKTNSSAFLYFQYNTLVQAAIISSVNRSLFTSLSTVVLAFCRLLFTLLTVIFLKLKLNYVLPYIPSIPVKICLQCRRPRFDSWVGKIPGEGNGNPPPVFLPPMGESHGQKSLAGYSSWGRKSQT